MAMSSPPRSDGSQPCPPGAPIAGLPTRHVAVDNRSTSTSTTQGQRALWAILVKQGELRLGHPFPIPFFVQLFPLLHGGPAMTDSQHTTLADIAKHFDTLDDPRCHINRLHPLTSV